jgi:plasmid stabilization system protein ParE
MSREADLFEIGLYIAQEDVDASERLLDLLDQKLRLLASAPAMGRPRPEL